VPYRLAEALHIIVETSSVDLSCGHTPIWPTGSKLSTTFMTQ
jgi:hypothetical protein